ncbi:sensor histidine kinase [Fulvivirga sedimenti]|uniref:histidine kinase n=1 Tax=Fulvivirga sedimenti TaxID=2879465 RepID=A0A9X1KZH4_9BACT|nr:sensor histidine kinase [Fulvivirga sedimenti]MCA6078903.1 sensor histidine kinase [Fulvivirga sedimenti]
MGRSGLAIILILLSIAGCSVYSVNTGEAEESVYKINEWVFVKGSWQIGEEAGILVDVPHKWPNKTMSTFGHGMYQTTVNVPDNIRELAVLLPNILSAYTILINDNVLISGGKPSISAEEEKVRIPRGVIHIPDQYYRKGEATEIKILVSNHSYHVGGFIGPFIYGEHSFLIQKSVRKTLFAGIQCGALALMSIFLFVYYIFRKKDSYILFFSVLSFGLMLRILFSGEQLIAGYLPSVDGVNLLKITLITFYLGITLNYAVLAGLFPRLIPRWSQRIVWMIGLLSVALVVLLPLRISSFSVPFFQLFSVVAGVFLIYFTFKAAMQHREGAKTVLVGGMVAFLFLINDILFNARIIDTGDWSGWGVVIYLFLIVVVISRRFSSAMENEEGLLQRLNYLNKSLEQRVKERTRKIEEYQRQIEEEARTFRMSNDELKKSHEEEQSMIRVMIHDLQSPFNKIKGLAQIMRMNTQFKGQEESELNDMILKIAEEGKHLIDDLNVLTMYESHLNDVESFVQTSINDLLEDCVKAHAAYASSKNISVRYHGHHQVYSWINPNMLSRIIDNLLSNAIKFSPQESKVDVELIRRAQEYEIVVKDEGPGFTEADRKKIFGKFQKLSARPTQGESSTGLGLSIVKNLTELMGGRISVKSARGEGATFTLIFPVRHAEERIDVSGN